MVSATNYTVWFKIPIMCLVDPFQSTWNPPCILCGLKLTKFITQSYVVLNKGLDCKWRLEHLPFPRKKVSRYPKKYFLFFVFFVLHLEKEIIITSWSKSVWTFYLQMTITSNLPKTALSSILSKENSKQPVLESHSSSKDIKSWKEVCKCWRNITLQF